MIYLSHFIDSNTPVYGGVNNEITIDQIRSIKNGNTSNNSFFKFPGHIGTHIDFPFHFSLEGKKSSDYPPSFWIFNDVGFLNCPLEEVKNNIQKLSSNIELLILKTGFGKNRGDDIYWKEQPVIPADFAELFRNKFPKLRVFGFDMISLTSQLDKSEGKLAHINFLLNYNILILEDMDLNQLNNSPKKVIISPLQFKNADGVPCSVIAF